MSEGLRDRRVGFIGCGAMASALGGGLVAAGLSPAQITGADPDEGCRATFAEQRVPTSRHGPGGVGPGRHGIRCPCHWDAGHGRGVLGE